MLDTFTRQHEMKRLGHAILTGEALIGKKPFAVLLPDDLCVYEGDGVLKQMIKLYKSYQCSIVAIEEVSQDQTHKYGVIEGREIEDGVCLVSKMVEKPDPFQLDVRPQCFAKR